jgi:DNA-binding NarL/FixJ family response regulator
MNANGKYRILVVDDHPIVRHGIVQLLNNQPDFDCRLEADNADAALELLREQSVDLAIVDISLPGLSGLDLIRRMRTGNAALPVLVLSMHEESVYADRALAAGARGYVMKHEATEKLIDAARKLLAGGLYLSRDVEERMFQTYVGGAGTGRTEMLSRLTQREFEVLQMIAQGITSTQIAARINRSVKSVEGYRAAIRAKLGARTTVDLARLALEYFPANPRAHA